MFYRAIYTCIQAWKHRKILANYTRERNLQTANIFTIAPQKLLEQGIQALIIDFDGVLASLDKIEPAEEARQWLQECCKIFGPQRIFILSNKPTLARKHYFAKYFIGLNFIITAYKKPFPYSILEIIQTTKLLPQEILIIDDRLLTGILAAIISKVRGCLITSPLIDYQCCPIKERIYNFLRQLERKIFQHY